MKISKKTGVHYILYLGDELRLLASGEPGQAEIEIDGTVHRLEPLEGIEIPPQTPHRIYTSATLLINQGVHAKIISERLGHGNIQVTMNTYGFALRSADQNAADKFESILIRKYPEP